MLLLWSLKALYHHGQSLTTLVEKIHGQSWRLYENRNRLSWTQSSTHFYQSSRQGSRHKSHSQETDSETRFVCMRLLGSSSKNDTYDRWAKQTEQREMFNCDTFATGESGAWITLEKVVLSQGKEAEPLCFSMRSHWMQATPTQAVGRVPLDKKAQS